MPGSRGRIVEGAWHQVDENVQHLYGSTHQGHVAVQVFERHLPPTARHLRLVLAGSPKALRQLAAVLLDAADLGDATDQGGDRAGG